MSFAVYYKVHVCKVLKTCFEKNKSKNNTKSLKGKVGKGESLPARQHLDLAIATCPKNQPIRACHITDKQNNF